MASIPTGEFSLHGTGCYGCVRRTPSDGACGIAPYPCVHLGADLFAVAPEVFAPEGGFITDVDTGRDPPFKGYGPGVIMIQGDSGFFHLLSHLALGSITVQRGQRVEEGDLLAKFEPSIGHTHWEVRKQRVGPAETNTVDPLGFWIPSQQRSQPAQTSGGQGQSRSAAFGSHQLGFVLPPNSTAEGESATVTVDEGLSTTSRVLIGLAIAGTIGAVGFGVWRFTRSRRLGGRRI